MIRIYYKIREWLCDHFELHKPNGTLYFDHRRVTFEESECEFCKAEIRRLPGGKWHSTEKRYWTLSCRK